MRNSAANSCSCPRCGYDLSGHVAAWNDTCPLHGQCSECGLSFNWANLLNQKLQDLPWLYEHAPHFTNVRRLAGTALRALFPWRFWADVKLHHRIRPRRLLLYLILPLLLTYAASVLLGAVSMALVWIPNATAAPLIYAFSSTDYRANTVTTLQGSTVSIARDGVTVSIPNAHSPLSDPVLHETKLGPVLVINETNMGGWSIDSFEIPKIPLIDPDSFMPQRRWVSPDGDIQPQALIATYIYRDRSRTPDSLQDLLTAVLLDPIGARSQQSSGALMNTLYDYPAVNPALILIFGFMIVAVAIILAAPSEWRHARIRHAHLLRVSVYSLTPLFAVFALILFAHAWAYIGTALSQLPGQTSGLSAWSVPLGWYTPPRWLASFATDRPSLWFIAIIVIWTPLYWWFAFTRGMQLNRPIALWFFVTLGGLLGGAALLALLVSPYYYWR